MTGTIDILNHLAIKNDIEKLKAELSAEIEKSKLELIKWVAGMLVAQGSAVAALVKIF